MKIDSYFKNKALDFLKNKGYKLIKTVEFEEIINYYKKVLIEKSHKKVDNKIECIVFSKDRAMQLHAFLQSYIEKATNYGRMYILYKFSNEAHRQSYQELKNIYSNVNFIFIEENDFRTQLIQICDESEAKTIGLFVDDMIFIRSVDFNHLLQFDPLDYVISLGRGVNLDYSVVLERKQAIPNFENLPLGFKAFNWNFTQEHSDWTFPLGVSGYFFGSVELIVMLKNIHFKAPNSLEFNLQCYKPFFINRKGVCKEDFVCVGVHANIVQNEDPNPTLGTYSIEELLKYWNEGRMIDLHDFYDSDGAQAQFKKYKFIDRV